MRLEDLDSSLVRVARPHLLLPLLWVITLVYFSFLLSPLLDPEQVFSRLSQQIDDLRRDLSERFDGVLSVAAGEEVLHTERISLNNVVYALVTFRISRSADTDDRVVVVSRELGTDLASVIAIFALLAVSSYVYSVLYRDFTTRPRDDMFAPTPSSLSIDYERLDPKLATSEAEHLIFAQLVDAKKRSLDLYRRSTMLLGSGIIMAFAGIAIFYVTSPVLQPSPSQLSELRTSLARSKTLQHYILSLGHSSADQFNPIMVDLSNARIFDLVKSNPELLNQILAFNKEIYVNELANQGTSYLNPLHSYFIQHCGRWGCWSLLKE